MSAGDYDENEHASLPRGSDLSVPTIHGSQDWGRSRSSIKRERVGNETALNDLVAALLPLSLERWEQMGVPEIAIDKLLDAKKIKSYTAKARQVRAIRASLRDADWTQIRFRLDQYNSGYAITPPTEEPASDALVWSEQLIIQGDSGLARFMEEYPNADRKRLRQLVRNVLKSPTKRGKTRLQLDRAVVLYLGEHIEEADDQ